MTTLPKASENPVAVQALTFLESLMEDMAIRALQRVSPPVQAAPLWIDANEASKLLGAGYTARRVKELGHMKKVVMDKLHPGVSNSPWIFERQSILNYSARRVFEIDQAKP